MSWGNLVGKLRDVLVPKGKSDALEKRKTWREKGKVEVLGFRADGEELDLVVIEFSAGGIRLQSPFPLKKGEELTLRLSRGKHQAFSLDEKQQQDPRVRVMWSQRRGVGSTYHCGAMFVMDDPAQRKAVARFLIEDCKVTIRNPEEKRKTTRVSLHAKAVFSSPDGSMTAAEVLNISLGGASLKANRSLQVSTRVHLKVKLSDKRDFECNGVIVRCQEVGQHRIYKLAVKFEEPPEEQQKILLAGLAELRAHSSEN